MRTIAHTTPGPVAFELDVDAAAVTVSVEDRDSAVVTLEAVDPGDREAARLIERTTASGDADRFTVRVPSSAGGNGTTVIRDGRGSVQVISGNVTGTVTGLVLGSGVTIVNGQVISGGGTTVVHGGGGLRITVRLPHGSTVTVTGKSTDLAVHGPLPRVEATTVSGDIDVRRLSGHARVQTVSGDITVHAVTASRVEATTVSGDIDITAEPGVEVDADTRTVSGRTRNRTRW